MEIQCVNRTRKWKYNAWTRQENGNTMREQDKKWCTVFLLWFFFKSHLFMVAVIMYLVSKLWYDFTILLFDLQVQVWQMILKQLAQIDPLFPSVLLWKFASTQTSPESSSLLYLPGCPLNIAISCTFLHFHWIVHCSMSSSFHWYSSLLCLWSNFTGRLLPSPSECFQWHLVCRQWMWEWTCKIKPMISALIIQIK